MLKEYLLFEVSENTVRAETQKMGKLQLDADEELVKEMQDEKVCKNETQSSCGSRHSVRLGRRSQSTN